MDDTLNRSKLSDTYQAIRSKTETLCEPLTIEDHIIQSMDDVSPPRWHLAHTTWFFETFILTPHDPSYQLFDPLYTYLFNSYYNGVGAQYPRQTRGIQSRPSVETIYDYRSYVNEAIHTAQKNFPHIHPLIELGLHHEQQHQELLLMDIKHNFYMQPHLPTYQPQFGKDHPATVPALQFKELSGGLVNIGHTGNDFCYDNELPLHEMYLQPYSIANRLVTNEEYKEFIEAGGYKNPLYWLIDGWAAVQRHNWDAPLYWEKRDNEWYQFTLSGLKKINWHEPVCHVSYFEANAYANWRGLRLPTEAEWENYVISEQNPLQGNFVESNLYHPKPYTNHSQVFGDVWEWTSTEYHPYPGFKPLRGTIGEYNGKFMNNQKVLRGGSCATPISHIRKSYRNYFECDKRWQFSGIRLASDK